MFITEEHYKIAKENGIQEATLYRRVHQYGWDIEKAITTPPIPRQSRSRKHPKKYTDLALANGVCLITFYARLKRGWTYEQASSIKPLPLYEKLKNIGGIESDKE